MHSVGYAHSDVGRKRDQNEDSCWTDDVLGIYIVSDGMGGHAAGEVASATAIETVVSALREKRELLRAVRRDQGDPEELVEAVNEALEKACSVVYKLAKSEADKAGMGCTLTVLVMAGRRAVMGHVGDTRLYLLRNESLSQLSVDHTMANELFKAGVIAEEEIKTHHYAHVLTRAIGTQRSVSVDTLKIDVVPGDVFLLCSDGLSDHVTGIEWLQREMTARTTDEIPEELVAFANAAGGDDNITCVAVEVNADDPEVDIVDELSTEIQGKFDALSSVFMFDTLNLALQARVLNHCKIESYQDGDVVIEQGELCEQLMVALDGSFELLCDGERVGLLEATDYAGATTLLAPRAARAAMRSVGAARLLILHRSPFWSLIKQRPWLGVGLLERLGRQISQDLDQSMRLRESDPGHIVRARDRF